MRVLKLTNSALPGSKPALFAMTAVHAREYTTAELGLRFAEQLLQGYGSDAEATWLLDHHEIHLLVQSNPDGRKRAETGLLWRKNTNQGYCGATSNSRGADLNRNFPFCLGHGDRRLQPERLQRHLSWPRTCIGAGDKAIVDYVRALYPDRRGDGLNDPAPDDTQGVFLDIHSYSQLVLWPWGITAQPSPNDPPLVALGRRFAWFNGYRRSSRWACMPPMAPPMISPTASWACRPSRSSWAPPSSRTARASRAGSIPTTCGPAVCSQGCARAVPAAVRSRGARAARRAGSADRGRGAAAHRRD
jgi:hypothetical protein